MDYEQLQKANQTIKTVSIKGKDYAEVNERIRVFRMLYPEGSIITSIVKLDETICVFKAEACDGDKILGIGHAFEIRTNQGVNRTSYVENCETSAVGRALGMCGIGDTSIASADEVKHAIAQQNEQEDDDKRYIEERAGRKISEVNAKVLYDFAIKCGLTEEELLEELGVERLRDVTGKQYAEFFKKHHVEEDKTTLEA